MRLDFWQLSSGGAIATAGILEFQSRGCAMRVLDWLHFFGSGTLVVEHDLSQHPWPGC